MNHSVILLHLFFIHYIKIIILLLYLHAFSFSYPEETFISCWRNYYIIMQVNFLKEQNIQRILVYLQFARCFLFIVKVSRFSIHCCRFYLYGDSDSSLSFLSLN